MAMTRIDVAVLRCMEICAEEGWLPNADLTLRLIRLREEYRAGLRSEHAVGAPAETPAEQTRRFRNLEWVRWMIQRGVLNEG